MVKTDAQITRFNREKVLSAIKNSDLKSLRGLITSGLALDFKDRETGLTPLMVAAKANQLEIVQLLVSVLDEKGLNVLDKDGKNAIIWSIIGPGKKPNKITRKMIRVLVKAGVDVKVEDAQGLSALDYVATRKYRSRRIAIYLRAKGA